MDEMCCYLNLHKEIEKVVLLLECVEHEYYNRLKNFIKNANIRNLTLTGLIGDRLRESIEVSIKHAKLSGEINSNVLVDYTPFDELSEYEGNWALCVIDSSSDAVIKASKLKPRHALINIWYERIDAFRIWEEYRDKVDYIQIRTLTPGQTSRILEWERSDNNIELSVIFPTYNVSKYLDECITSIIEWDAPYVEYIFVNDGSTDDSGEVIEKWQAKDSRIKLINKENGGCASARQVGLENARGKYIGFIDPDDYINPRMFNTLLREAMIGSYEAVYCGYNEQYENDGSTSIVKDTLGEPFCNGTSDINEIRTLLIYLRIAIWRGIYKKEMIDRAGIHFYTELRRFDDLPFKFEIYANAKSVKAVQEYLYYYRLARPGQDVSADDERLYVHFDIFKHLNESILPKGSQELTDYLQLVKIQTHAWALEKIKDEYKAEYTRMAKEDLLTTGNEERTYRLAMDRIGKENAEIFKIIMS